MDRCISAPKRISLCSIMVSLMALWRSSLDIRFRRGTFHSFACSNNFVNVIIYFYCNPQLGYNFFLYTCSCLLLHLKIYIIIWTTQLATLLSFCIIVFTLFNIYLEMVVFTLFVHRVNLQHCCCITIFVIWSILTLKIRLKDTMKAFNNFEN